ncbi:MAG: HlyD family efflux transporter periplasmic adaptor subunit [Planctomycetota bacterium]
MNTNRRVFPQFAVVASASGLPTILLAGATFLTAASGCQPGGNEEAKFEKPPKPVSVMTLSRSKQLQEQLITGSIAPWKTEQVGFEVSGRVNFVIEQNEEIQPVLPSGVAKPATPLATLEPERFEIAIETALADVEVAQKQLEANQVAITQRLPASIESAESEMEVAEADFDRVTQLIEQSAISRAEFDDAKNRLRAAQAALTASQAQLAQAKAQQAALQAQVNRAQQSVEEAERNLRNTRLFSSFRGIISQVHTVPGSYVNPGDPVVTVQMMDPMLVEFEVSPKDSRKYARGDILNVFIADGHGNRERSSGMVYTVDAVADPNSRTYTVALHIRNKKEPFNEVGTEIDCRLQTEHIYSLNVGPVITGDTRQLVEQRCLHKIGDNIVVWKISNRKANQPSDPSNRVLIVEPVKVSCGSDVIPLLGQWNFVPVEFEDPSQIDIENDLITDQLVITDVDSVSTSKEDPWAPRRVLLNQQRWKLRTGDVVQVLMSGNSVSQGFFVPMKAVLSDNGSSFVHVIESAADGTTTARRVQVTLPNDTSMQGDSIQVQVQPVEASGLSDGMQIVIAGTHYLTGGDRVNVVSIGGTRE